MAWHDNIVAPEDTAGAGSSYDGESSTFPAGSAAKTKDKEKTGSAPPQADWGQEQAADTRPPAVQIHELSRANTTTDNVKKMAKLDRAMICGGDFNTYFYNADNYFIPYWLDLIRYGREEEVPYHWRKNKPLLKKMVWDSWAKIKKFVDSCGDDYCKSGICRQTETVGAYTSNPKCDAIGGTCMEVKDCTGKSTKGLCKDPSSSIQCCTGGTTPSGGGGTGGGVPVGPTGASVEKGVGDSCNARGVAGTCMHTKDCTSGYSTPGFCLSSKSKDVQCCTSTKPPASGGGGGGGGAVAPAVIPDLMSVEQKASTAVPSSSWGWVVLLGGGAALLGVLAWRSKMGKGKKTKSKKRR